MQHQATQLQSPSPLSPPQETLHNSTHCTASQDPQSPHQSSSIPRYTMISNDLMILTLPLIGPLLTSKTNLFSSIIAMFFPAHIHCPYPNASSTFRSISAFFSAETSVKRSGRKMSASGPKRTRERSSADVLVQISVPGGRYFPCNVSPEEGTTLGQTPRRGGRWRIPS